MRSFDDRPAAADPSAAGADPSPTPPPADPPHLSPSLRADRNGATAYEVKFLLPDDLAREVERRVAAAAGLTRDPHSDPVAGGYRTTTVYCDTPGFDVFHGTGVGKRRKHRVRRYGYADFVFLERKTKRGTAVSKKRSAVPVAEVPALADRPAEGGESGWAGEWFRRRLARHALRPVCRMSYLRTAYGGQTADGPLRLTFDRSLCGALVDGWHVAPVDAGPDLLDGLVIVEFKFQGALPAAAKRVVEDLRLAPSGASKYRRFLASTGKVRVPPPPKADPSPAVGGVA